MKKIIGMIALGALSLMIFVACSNQTEGTDSSESADDSTSKEQVTIEYATGFKGGDGQIGESMRKFAEIVEEKSNGEIKIELFDSGSVGDERDILESVRNGSIDMSLAGISDVVYWLPEYFLSAPYLFRDQEHVRAVYEGELGKEIDEKVLEETGIRTLSIMNRGPRHISSNVKIESPENIKGLRIRMPENPLWIDTWGELGATTTTIALSELYTALQTDMVDAQENPLETIVENQFYEVQNYVILSGHVRDVYKVQISEKTWEKLSDEHKGVIEEAANEASLYGDEVLEESEKQQLETLENEGVEIIEPDLDAFRNYLGDKGEEIANKHMKEGLYETIQNDY